MRVCQSSLVRCRWIAPFALLPVFAHAQSIVSASCASSGSSSLSGSNPSLVVNAMPGFSNSVSGASSCSLPAQSSTQSGSLTNGSGTAYATGTASASTSGSVSNGVLTINQSGSIVGTTDITQIADPNGGGYTANASAGGSSSVTETFSLLAGQSLQYSVSGSTSGSMTNVGPNSGGWLPEYTSALRVNGSQFNGYTEEAPAFPFSYSGVITNSTGALALYQLSFEVTGGYGVQIPVGGGFTQIPTDASLIYDITFTGTPVPLPASVWLMLSGLGGLAVLCRKRSARQLHPYRNRCLG